MENQYLRDARAGKQWSPEVASQHVGVTEKTYRRWEAGTHIPQMRQLEALCQAFNDKRENLGYIIDEKGHILLRPPEDDLAFMDDPDNPTRNLALAYEDIIESLRMNLMLFSGMESSEQEASEVDRTMRVVLSILTPSLDMASVGVAIWLCDRVSKLRAISTCGLRITVQQYLAIIFSEIESWKIMIDEDYQLTEAYSITRRTVIGSLAVFPSSFLTVAQMWPMTDSMAKGFVLQCTPCIMACADLLKGNGFTTVEQILPQYLRPLVRLAKSPSSVQKEAAYLAAQGLCLMDTVKWHRCQYSKAVALAQQAVDLAKVTGDRVLIAAALTHLGSSWDDCLDQPNTVKNRKYLEAYEDAEHLMPNVPPFFPARLQSRIYMGLANAHARFGNHQKADHYLGMANAIELLPDDNLFIPILLYGPSVPNLIEAQVYVNLGTLQHPDLNVPSSKEVRILYENADRALGYPFLGHESEAIRVRIVNERVAIAIRLGQKEKFKQLFMEGVQGAQTLDSKARLKEVKAAWRLARRRWPGEDDVQNLDEVLL